MEHIFICYSRADRELALQLKGKMESHDKNVWIDLEDLPASSSWREEIRNSITEAVAFIYLISDDSLRSEYCQKEFDFACELNKRIFPILSPKITGKDIPEKISSFQWLRWDDFGEGFNISKLITDIETDFNWVKFITDLGVKTSKWDKQKDASRLLRGKELQEAEQLLANAGVKDPQPTDLLRQYILESRRNEERQRRQITIGLSFALAIVVLLAVFSWGQRNKAVASESTAVAEANAKATALIREKIAVEDAQTQRSVAVENLSIAQTQESIAKQNEAVAIANEKEAKKQALLATSKNLSALASTRIDIDYTQSLLLGVESFRLLEENNLSDGYDPDILPTLLQKTQTGLTETLIFPPTGTVWKVTYSKDGKFMASASDTTDLWDTADPYSPKLIKSWNDSQNNLGTSDVAFNPDGTILAAGYWDGHVDLWDVKKLYKIFSFTDYRSDKSTKKVSEKSFCS